MRVSVKQVFIVFITVLLTLGILRGAQALYMTSAVRTPLIKTVDRVPGVEGVHISSSGIVNVQMKSTADLMAVYQAVNAESTAVLGHPPKAILFRNNPSPKLMSLTNQIRFIVAQGEATGQFVAMKNTIDQLCQRNGVTDDVEMGSANLFVTLKSQHQHVMYLITPLHLGGDSHG